MRYLNALPYVVIAVLAIALMFHVAGEASADSDNDDQKVEVSFYMEGNVSTGQEGDLDFEPPDDPARTEREVTISLIENSGDWIEMGTWRSSPFFNVVNLSGSDFQLKIYADAPEGSEPATDVTFRANINGNNYESDTVNLNNNNVISATISGTLSGTIDQGDRLTLTLSVKTDELYVPPGNSDRTIRIHYDSTEAEYGGAERYDSNINTKMQMMNTRIEFVSQNPDESEYGFVATHTIASKYIEENLFKFNITGAYEEDLPWRNASAAYLVKKSPQEIPENGSWRFDVKWLHGKQSGGVYPGTYNAAFTINDTFGNMWSREEDFLIHESPAMPDLRTIAIQIQRQRVDGKYVTVDDDVALYDDLFIKATFSVSANKSRDYQTEYLFYIDGVPYPDEIPNFIQLTGSQTLSVMVEWSPDMEGYVNVSVMLDPSDDINEGREQEYNNYKKVEPRGPDTDVFVQSMKRPTAVITSPAPQQAGEMAYVNVSSNAPYITLDGSGSTDPDDNITYQFYLRKTWPEKTEEEIVGTDSNGIGTYYLGELPTTNEVWVARLVVSDETGRMHSVEIEFTINVPPEVEIISPGDGDVFATGTNIEFRVDASDVNQNPLEYRWRSSLQAGYLSQSSMFETDGLKAGKHKITVTVKDGKGGVTEESIFIYVNTDPVIVISDPENGRVYPLDGTNGDGVVFDAGDTYDPDDNELEFSWRMGTMPLSDESYFKKKFSSSGEYVITLRVWDLDDLGERIRELPTTETVTVVVSTPPEAIINDGKGSVKIEEKKSLTLTASYDDPDGDAVDLYMWDLDGDSVFETETNNPETSKKFDKKGDYVVRLKVVDEWGAESDVATLNVKVEKKDDSALEIAGMDGYLFLGGIGAAVVVLIVVAVLMMKGRSGTGPLKTQKKQGAGKKTKKAAGPAPAAPACPACGGELEYIDEYQSWYCYNCEDYQ